MDDAAAESGGGDGGAEHISIGEVIDILSSGLDSAPPGIKEDLAQAIALLKKVEAAAGGGAPPEAAPEDVGAETGAGTPTSTGQ